MQPILWRRLTLVLIIRGRPQYEVNSNILNEHAREMKQRSQLYFDPTRSARGRSVAMLWVVSILMTDDYDENCHAAHEQGVFQDANSPEAEEFEIYR